jgi:hypothetical protein
VNPPLSQTTSPRRGRLPVLLTALGVLVATIALGLIGIAGAARSIELGKTKSNPKPNCPTPKEIKNGAPPNREDEFCQVNGDVTGFQRSVEGKKGLFRVPSDGHIVAWSVRLSKPSKSERNTFGGLARSERYGEKPTAGISIIRKTKGQRYRLMRKSPVVTVQNYYGDSPVFTLNKPLRVNQGNIVAMTTLTWLPNLAAKNQARSTQWVGSRTQKKFPDANPNDGVKSCDLPPNLSEEERGPYFFENSSAHKKVGSERRYGCEYRRARLMYWAYFVPNRAGGGGGGGGGD